MVWDQIMSSQSAKPAFFACRQCRASKRRCDGVKPQCSYCQKTEKECEYTDERKTRKRKYWDENYVKSLENQVRALLALQNNDPPAALPQNAPRPADSVILDSAFRLAPLGKSHQYEHPAPLDHLLHDRASHQSQTAMEELSVMMWRTNLADAVTVDEKQSTDKMPTSQSNPQTEVPHQIPGPILNVCSDATRLHELAALFLDCINQEHQLTQYDSANFYLHTPNQSPDLLFLHAAMLATGATFENKPDSLKISDEFAELSESLIFKCFRQCPSIYTLQGLNILSWRSLALGHDHFGWTFLSMAAGMAVHLRLHVLALDDFDSKSASTGFAGVLTFWSFYMIDRASISILGRNCMLPWRRVNVPVIESFFPRNGASLAQVSFAWQCKLWYMHDQNMDQIFSSSFETLTTSEQVRLLITTHENLSQFFKSRDPRLAIKRSATEKPVFLFHMAYQMAILVTMPPFLRLFAKMRNENPNSSQLMPVVLQSLTAAATAMVRLVQDYCKTWGFPRINPILIHHLLSATIVHLMNTTTESFTLRRFSTRSVRKCLAIFRQLSLYWRARSQKSVDLIKTLARRWNVEFALPEETEFLEGGFAGGLLEVQDGGQPDRISPSSGAELNVPPSGTSEEGPHGQFNLFGPGNTSNDVLYPEGQQDIFTLNSSLLENGCTDLFPMFQDFNHFGDNFADMP